MKLLSVNNISKWYGTKQVLSDISFSVEKGSIISIFGPNAAGKTTLLNIISGLILPDNGEIHWATNTTFKKTSYVFQNYRESLFPWRNVWENISLPLKLKGVQKEIRKEKVIELLDKLSIDVDIYKFPYLLSGGQQQLVSILRGLITEPELLLLDEPFSALDIKRRMFLQDKVLEIWDQFGLTILFISHDLDEAIYMADKVLLLGETPTKIVTNVTVNIERPRMNNVRLSDSFFRLRRDLGTYIYR